MDKKKKRLGGVALVGIISALFAAACKGKGDDFKPNNNIEPEVYGPPFTNSEDIDAKEENTGFITKEDISGNISLWDISDNRKEAPPSDGFKPADNIAYPVYGPPKGKNNEATE